MDAIESYDPEWDPRLVSECDWQQRSRFVVADARSDVADDTHARTTLPSVLNLRPSGSMDGVSRSTPHRTSRTRRHNGHHLMEGLFARQLMQIENIKYDPKCNSKKANARRSYNSTHEQSITRNVLKVGEDNSLMRKHQSTFADMSVGLPVDLSVLSKSRNSLFAAVSSSSDIGNVQVLMNNSELSSRESSTISTPKQKNIPEIFNELYNFQLSKSYLAHLCSIQAQMNYTNNILFNFGGPPGGPGFVHYPILDSLVSVGSPTSTLLPSSVSCDTVDSTARYHRSNNPRASSAYFTDRRLVTAGDLVSG